MRLLPQQVTLLPKEVEFELVHYLRQKYLPQLQLVEYPSYTGNISFGYCAHSY